MSVKEEISNLVTYSANDCVGSRKPMESI